MATSWKKAQKWEEKWWGNCVNTLFEEEKQLVYADRMGLDKVGSNKTPYVFDLHGTSVLDIGGGPISLLLKCINLAHGVVIDPCDYPEWVKTRYENIGIKYYKVKGEDILTVGISDEFQEIGKFEEIWIYNVLQHTDNPHKVIKNARQVSKLIRIFEWLETPISEGHIHTLNENDLNEWLGGEGKVEIMNQRPCFGKAYYGVFPT